MIRRPPRSTLFPTRRSSDLNRLKVKGKRKIIKFKGASDMPHLAVSLLNTEANLTGSWRSVRPIYINRVPPCKNACPAGEDIHLYLELISKKKFREGWKKIIESNPFPGVCGRICYHPCERKCLRGKFDKEISIHSIERLAADYVHSHSRKDNKKIQRKKTAKQGKKIAVIGAGPAGLTCAYFLSKMGYRVTIFEASSAPGGMMRQGIPEYRLPKKVLDKEIEDILDLGIKVKNNTRIGTDIDIGDIRRNYNAIFIATGAHMSKKLELPGKGNSSRVILGLDFLKDQNHGHKTDIGEKIAIIGGGNTAIDIARSVLRQGAKPMIIYRRSREEIPAIEEEIHQVEEEGIILHYLTSPTDIIMDEEGKKINLGCIRMKLGKPDKTGRRAPVAIKDSNFIIEADSVIAAIGEDPDLSFLPSDIKTNKMGIVIDTNNATTLEGIFAGGDAAGEPRSVVNAIGSGKRGAYSIDRYLGGLKREEISKPSIVQYEDLNLDYFEKGKWIEPLKIAVEDRINDFKEVNRGFSTKMGITEASRCFSCGVCNMCDNCLIFCPDITVVKKKKGYEINYDYCKGCLICVEECPRSAMTSIEEIK